MTATTLPSCTNPTNLKRAKVNGNDAPDIDATLLLSMATAGIEVFDKRNGHLIWRKDRS